MTDETASGRETVVFGAGCFWGVEDALRVLPGVVATRVGYAGGRVASPTYEQVCSGGTGHAEAVEVTFDPTATTLEKLLTYFWTHHAATGRDLGQYRSLVVCGPEQAAAVAAVRAEIDAAATNGEPVTTEVLVDVPFYEAEEYHQQYYDKQRELVREVRRRCDLTPLEE